ncbi:MAG TPA: SDR family NAD(P)-dependent oxidoreductase [Polyangiaceae bacterium]|jgi:NAD(P)-dependent dehydrogenase (short-subunit alcohol dehydrogenase family)
MGSDRGSVVVTGGAGALGSATARRLAKLGWRVALVSRPEERDVLKGLAAELGRAIAVEADVGSAEAWTAALAKIDAEVGAPEGAALIAGTWQGGTPLHAEKDDKVWRAMLTTNLETVHASLRALVPGMVARRRGSVVVIGSRAVERPWTSASAAAYGTSKAAVVALAQTVAAEVVESGVRINAILPSTLDTAANRRAMPDADPGRWVTTDSAAGVIAFLLSDDARDVSGAAIPVYGRA